MFDADILSAAEAVLADARAKGLRLATAESCTGGLIIGALTEIAGSSDVVDRGFVTYSNEAKHELLGVEPKTIAKHGAVSGPVVRAMAEGALSRSRAQIAVAVSGVAGPGGGSADKPIGLVWFGLATKLGTFSEERRFGPIGRTPVRIETVRHALALIAAELGRR